VGRPGALHGLVRMQGPGWLNRPTAQQVGCASRGCPNGDANATAFASPQPGGQAAPFRPWTGSWRLEGGWRRL